MAFVSVGGTTGCTQCAMHGWFLITQLLPSVMFGWQLILAAWGCCSLCYYSNKSVGSAWCYSGQAPVVRFPWRHTASSVVFCQPVHVHCSNYCACFLWLGIRSAMRAGLLHFGLAV